jgi:hypothetical protein
VIRLIIHQRNANKRRAMIILSAGGNGKGANRQVRAL